MWGKKVEKPGKMLKSLLFTSVENVDNVDKYLDNLLWETAVTVGIVEKTWESTCHTQGKCV